MIKIKPYYDHPAHKKIFDRYLYLAALVLPFPPEAVIGDEKLTVDGKEITTETVLQERLQHCKTQLGKKSKKYKDALAAYSINSKLKGGAELFDQEQLLAAKVIQEASPELYEYLYETDDKSISPADVPPMKKEHVRRLLTVPMNNLDNDLKKIGQIDGETIKTINKDTYRRTKSDELQDFVFRYESFSKRDQTFQLLKDMDVNVCPYCNRIYTVTLTEKGHRSRPQFDHYLSKSKYPYFAISLLNLIPCCGLCNQAKSNKEDQILYPYFEEMGTDVMFRTKAENGLTYLTGCPSAEDEFSIELEETDSITPELQEKVQKSKDVFHLTQLYNEHKDYVLYLYRKRYMFSDEYLQMICDSFPEMAGKFDELEGLLYLMDLEKEQWGRRPLAKLTHDIDLQITEEQGKIEDLTDIT
ncbi:hypothetical protein [[Ruminococcus] torques]|uniref:hypothetical protein n=1 Tax=[Ruminococcus] torques TaxID=33039 RepID=UPI0025A322D1|nr:hypothetical protein [[Ruminococcus] torques]MDM8236723.1 hypothetical protein [[Ruminococcus] torques]